MATRGRGWARRMRSCSVVKEVAPDMSSRQARVTLGAAAPFSRLPTATRLYCGRVVWVGYAVGGKQPGKALDGNSHDLQLTFQ